jgi:hypothetical protein
MAPTAKRNQGKLAISQILIKRAYNKGDQKVDFVQGGICSFLGDYTVEELINPKTNSGNHEEQG